VTSGLAAVFLAGVLVSTWFIDGLEPAWEYGVPFFVLLTIGYFLTARRRPAPAATPAPAPAASAGEGAE
jgi:L-asparagine transporter-like permease